MANPRKRKGDRFERKAVRFLSDLVPDLLVSRPMRKLGAGRKDDSGDLWVLADVAVQVKAWADLPAGVLLAARGAKAQAANGALRFSVGMIPIPGGRAPGLTWVFTTYDWPGPLDVSAHPVFGLTSRACGYLRDDAGPCRAERIAVVRRAGEPPLVLSTGQAWAAAYRRALAGQAAPNARPGAVAQTQPQGPADRDATISGIGRAVSNRETPRGVAGTSCSPDEVKDRGHTADAAGAVADQA